MRSLVALTLAAAFVLSCNTKREEPSEAFKPSEAPPIPPGPDKLEKTDEVVGTGAEAATGDKVKMHYTGTLMNGTEFDSSRKRAEPFEFTIGKGDVIKGWDEGIPGMKVGGKRKLVIPWPLAYGEAGRAPTIPPKAALKFDVELVEVEGKGAAPAPSASAAPKKK